MAHSDGSDFRWSRPGLVTLTVEAQTMNDPAEGQERITIISLRGPNEIMQRVVLSEGESEELAVLLHPGLS